MTDIEIAERALAKLQDKFDRATQRSSEITAERSAVGYDVHVNADAKARTRLDRLNAEAISLAGEMESIKGAITSATQRLDAAKAAAARAARRAEIAEHRERIKQVRALGPFMDKGLIDLRDGLVALTKHSAEVGRDFRHVQTLIRVLRIALFDTPLRLEIGVADSNDRRAFSSFASVVNGWCDGRDGELARELASLGTEPDEKGRAA